MAYSPGGWRKIAPDGSDLDPDTGLPALKEGFYWRVTAYPTCGYFLRVLLMQRRSWFWGDRIVSSQTSEPDAACVLLTARYIVNRLREDEQARTTRERLIGNYPPKKLNKENN